MTASNSSKRVIVATIGARRHYSIPIALSNSGYLERFFTDTYLGNKPILLSLLQLVPKNWRPKLLEKIIGRCSPLPPERVTSFDSLGIRYFFSLKWGKKYGRLEEVYCDTATSFANKIKSYGLATGNIVISCNGASLEIFQNAKINGLYCILDQTSNPKPLEEKLTEEEHKKWHTWIPESDKYVKKSLLKDREILEWELADSIITGSNFVKKGLIDCGVPEEKIHVIPERNSSARFKFHTRDKFTGNRPLKVLYVGNVSVMKGIPYLLEGLRLIEKGRIQTRVVGSLSITGQKIIEYSDVAEFIGAVPRSEVESHYRWADVFCFPSITEGSAGVTYEALATGLPVITTPNAGSIVHDGVDGFIIPIRDSLSLARSLMRYLDSPETLHLHQHNIESCLKAEIATPSKSDLIKFVEKITLCTHLKE